MIPSLLGILLVTTKAEFSKYVPYKTPKSRHNISGKGFTLPPQSDGYFINSGTPIPVPLEFDCAVREYAWEYGIQIQNRHGSFVTLYDALQLNACNVTRPNETERNIPKYDSNNNDNNNCVYYIDPVNGNDSNDGLKTVSAFKSIERGIERTRIMREGKQVCTLNLMKGVHYQATTIDITSKDSYLTIQNYNGEEAVLSGGVAIDFGSNEWELVDYAETDWVYYANNNNVYGRADDGESNDAVRYLGTVDTYDECLTLAKNSNAAGGNPFYWSITWHSLNFTEGFTGQCFGTRDLYWGPYSQENIESARFIGKNIWKRKVVNSAAFGNEILGLRVDNKRGIRARYPDQDPEIAMQYDPISGWLLYDTVWKPPIKYPNAENVIVNASSYPNVEWPMDGPGGTTWTGEGDWGNFYIGKGGPCETSNKLGGVDPPFGYWCSATAPRQITEHECPSGITLDSTFGMNLPYSNLSGAVVHAWRPAHWYTNMYAVDGVSAKSGDVVDFIAGGFQGGEGESVGAEWYIENVFEELTMPNEYYYNTETQELYYFNNETSKTPPSNDVTFVATYNNILMNVTGTQNDPVKNTTIRGITFKDTRYTYLDPHGLPSGGDWAIARQGAITVEGSEYTVIDNILMTRVDGNGIFFSGYNRNCSVSNSDFEYIGESAMASWGYSSGLENVLPGAGPDGRDGNQPRFTTIENNLIREIGIWEKQASFWFEAVTAQTRLVNNIFFNGPRAGVNENDGFGGDTQMYGNLLLNTCRESGDHGPWNSWDRVPYITTIGSGKASIIPATNKIHNNFIIGTYQSQSGVDTDDGSSYYENHDNFYVYGDFGIKSDFGGHDNYHTNNVYAYIGDWYLNCCISGYKNEFNNNKVILRTQECGTTSCYTSTCNLPQGSETMSTTIYNNTIWNPTGNNPVCGESWQKWQSKGNDPGTTINITPDDPNAIIDMGKALLNNN